jgi:hypothetical protein
MNEVTFVQCSENVKSECSIGVWLVVRNSRARGTEFNADRTCV